MKKGKLDKKKAKKYMWKSQGKKKSQDGSFSLDKAIKKESIDIEKDEELTINNNNGGVETITISKKPREQVMNSKNDQENGKSKDKKDKKGKKGKKHNINNVVVGAEQETETEIDEIEEFSNLVDHFKVDNSSYFVPSFEANEDCTMEQVKD